MNVPPDLYGRPRRDRAMAFLVGLTSGFTRAAEFYARTQPPVVAVDRDVPAVVRRVVAEADRVVSVVFGGVGLLPPWRPGCHVDVVLPSGEVRQYSLCGDPSDLRTYRIAVRLVGSGSAEVHGLVPGTQVVLRGPRNAFPYVGTGPVHFIAGGIGITPILPMVLAAERAGRAWTSVYWGRTRESMPFLGDLPQRVVVGSDDVDGVPSAADLLAPAGSGTSVYCCGPAPVIDMVRTAWASPLHVERFSPPPVVGGEPFSVQLGVGGPVVAVAGDESALTAVRRVRPDVRYSCRQGFCGTCRVAVVSRQSEMDSMLLCSDRVPGRVVIDAGGR